MMIGDFMHYYHYSLEQVLDMCAKSFYSLYSVMSRLRAREDMQDAHRQAVSRAGGEPFDSYIKHKHDEYRGLKGLIEQARLLRSIRK